jgi:N-acetylglucosamine-6-phosphate deacetylase
MMARLKHARKLRARSGELLRAIAGWHLEGPFLSGEPGFRGAHDPDAMRNPTPRHIRELRQITETDRVLMTIAPEREGAIAAISLAVSLGIKVNLGHTNASHALLLKAIRAGATGFTHLGNGCPRELDRHDNILWRLFETSGLATGLIPDGIHLSPALFRLMHRLIASEALYYTTDAMSAAGSRPGCYTLGRLKLKVDKSGIVRLPGTANFAGSALKPMDGIIRAAAMLGTRWQEVWPRFSKVPAKMAGLGGVDLKAGNRATFCLLRSASERTPRLIHTFWDGRGGSGRQQFSLWQQTRTPRGARGPTRPKKGRWFDESKPGPLTGRA